MKVDFTKRMQSLESTDLTDDSGPFTLARVACNALLAMRPDDKINGDEKARRYKLAVQLVDAGEVDLPAESIALTKKLIGEVYNPLIVGQAWEMLEGQ